MDLNSAVGREHGLSEDEFEDLHDYRNSSYFSDTEKQVLEYVSKLSRSPVDVSDSLFNSLKEVFDTRQLVEITSLAAWENYRARFNKGFDVQSQDFSEGEACVLPEYEPADGDSAEQR